MEQRAWIQLNQDKHPGVSVQVANTSGRTRIVGVMVTRPDGVTPDDLRSVPLPRLEAAWNTPGDRDSALVDATLRAAARRKALGRPLPETPTPPTKRELRLPRPKSGGRYPDAFYLRAAMLYQRLVANGRRPAPEIADANGVPVTTVHRWVKEARARGFLAPARKAGAAG